MREILLRRVRVIHPAPESLLPYALGDADRAIAAHVAGCVTCQGEVDRLREGADLLRGAAAFNARVELPLPQCPDELSLADFVEGRLSAEARAPVVAHLLTCARCRSVVKETAQAVADGIGADTSPARRWRQWRVPAGLAAAAALVVLFVLRGGEDSAIPGLREPTMTSTVAPTPIVPRAAVSRVDRIVWSSVPHAERYSLRLYDGQGTVVWRTETTDTFAALPDSVRLQPRVSYFWRVEAQTGWRRSTASDLVEFQLVPARR